MEAKLIAIQPNCSYLSPTELTGLRHVEVEPYRAGLKHTIAQGTDAESEELRKCLEKLRMQLSVPRIERLVGRALAVWDESQQAVKLLRKDGKFEYFGYCSDGKEYLEFYEALFLLEVGRLQLEHHSMIMSVEQAYLLLLGENRSKKSDEYLVYSNLARVGYIVIKHKNISYKVESNTTTMDCIWALLQESLYKKAIPYKIKNKTIFNKIKDSMEQTKQCIKQSISFRETTSESHSSPFKFLTRRRKAEDTEHCTSKKQCKATESQHLPNNNNSLIDFLKYLPDYRFEQIFQKFDIVPLKANDFTKTVNYNANCCRNLKISFDLYLHKDGYRKSVPKPPTLRAIILSMDDKFPSHNEIAKCYCKQEHAVPLIVVSVSESKQIQAHLYYFS